MSSESLIGTGSPPHWSQAGGSQVSALPQSPLLLGVYYWPPQGVTYTTGGRLSSPWLFPVAWSCLGLRSVQPLCPGLQTVSPEHLEAWDHREEPSSPKAVSHTCALGSG